LLNPSKGERLVGYETKTGIFIERNPSSSYRLVTTPQVEEAFMQER